MKITSVRKESPVSVAAMKPYTMGIIVGSNLLPEYKGAFVIKLEDRLIAVTKCGVKSWKNIIPKEQPSFMISVLKEDDTVTIEL